MTRDPKLTWAWSVPCNLDKVRMPELIAMITEAATLGLLSPNLATNADRRSWLYKKAREIREQRGQEGKQDPALPFNEPIPDFPAVINGIRCDMTASECNAHLRTMPLPPPYGEEDSAI